MAGSFTDLQLRSVDKREETKKSHYGCLLCIKTSHTDRAITEVEHPVLLNICHLFISLPPPPFFSLQWSEFPNWVIPQTLGCRIWTEKKKVAFQILAQLWSSLRSQSLLGIHSRTKRPKGLEWEMLKEEPRLDSLSLISTKSKMNGYRIAVLKRRRNKCTSIWDCLITHSAFPYCKDLMLRST